MTDMTEIDRIRAGRVWWEVAAPNGWALLGFSDRIVATFICQGNSISMCGVVAASIHERLAAARREALEEAARMCAAAVPRAHTYASENADIYRAGDHARDRCIAAIRALAGKETRLADLGSGWLISDAKAEHERWMPPAAEKGKSDV